MKSKKLFKVFRILSIVFSGLIILLSLVFAFIEFRLLFSNDFSIYSNPSYGVINIVLKLIIILFCLGTSIFNIIYTFKEYNRITNIYIVSFMVVYCALVLPIVIMFGRFSYSLIVKLVLIFVLLLSAGFTYTYITLKRIVAQSDVRLENHLNNQENIHEEDNSL